MDPLLHIEVDRGLRTPIAVQVSRQIRWLITGGQLVAGERLPPVRELAAQVGINLHTVRAAYRHLAADGLVATTHGRGTFVLPRDPARARAAAETPVGLIGILVPSYSELYLAFIDGAGLAAQAVSAMVVTSDVRESQADGARAAELLAAAGAVGIVAAAPIIDPNRLHGIAASLDQRLVVCDWPDAPQPGIDFDLEPGVTDAIEHLMGHGHDRIVLVAPPAEWENMLPLHQTVTRAARHAGAHIDHVPVFDYTEHAGTEAATRMHLDGDEPVAIIAASDGLARGVLAHVERRSGLDAGRVAVVSVDGDPPPTAAGHALTRVALPARRMGSEAVTMLSSMSPPQQAPRRRTLASNFVVGESCGPHDID